MKICENYNPENCKFQCRLWEKRIRPPFEGCCIETGKPVTWIEDNTNEDVMRYVTSDMVENLEAMLKEYSKTGIETEKEIGSFNNSYFCKILSIKVKLEKRIPDVDNKIEGTQDINYIDFK